MGMLRVNMQGNVENGGRLALCVMQNMLQCPLCVFVNSWLLQHASLKTPLEEYHVREKNF